MRRQNTSSIKLGLAALALTFLFVGVASGADSVATLRGSAIDQEPMPPKLSNPTNDDLRRVRNYPEQPPTIPHKVRDYQVDLNANKCLTCHSRRATEESQAPMISVTHFIDREGQVRAFMSARRYFCNQCHVPQVEEARPLTGNTFVDVEELVTGLGKQEN